MKTFLSAFLFVFCLVSSVYSGEILTDAYFKSNDVSKPVQAYNYYKDSVLVATIPIENTVEDGDEFTFELDCLDVPVNEGSFTLTAVYNDGTESPPSEPFVFNVPRCEKIMIYVIRTNVE